MGEGVGTTSGDDGNRRTSGKSQDYVLGAMESAMGGRAG